MDRHRNRNHIPDRFVVSARLSPKVPQLLAKMIVYFPSPIALVYHLIPSTQYVAIKDRQSIR